MRPLTIAALTALAILTSTPADAQTDNSLILITPNYRISISSRCEEGVVGCNNVIYNGVNIKTGKSITLKGEDAMHLCADGITPCHHLGYEFHHLGLVYFVSDDGLLTVTHKDKVILSEQGRWQ